MSSESPFDNKSQALQSWNLQEYISTLSNDNACLFFENISCVTELFSSLSEMQQNIVSRLMILGNEHGNYLGEKAMNIWISASKRCELEYALKKLRSLKIIKANILDSGSQSGISDSISVQYQLNPAFQKTLTKFIFEGTASIDFEIQRGLPEIGISYDHLTRFVRRKWSNILNIIVELSGNKDITKNYLSISKKLRLVSSDTMKVLNNIELISCNIKKDLNDHNSNNRGIRIHIDKICSSQESTELFDGFDHEDQFGFPNEYQNTLDIYNDVKYEIAENDSNNDEEYHPSNTKRRPKRASTNVQNNHAKNQIDKVFEQKLTSRTFCWLLCDTCKQLLILLNGFLKLIESESSMKNVYNGTPEYDRKIVNPALSSVISLILSISSSKIGQPISINKNMGNKILMRFILFAFDLGLLYIDESIIEQNTSFLVDGIDHPSISNIELAYTTPFSLLIGSEGLKLQSLYSALKISDNFFSKDEAEDIKSQLLPPHFYYNEKLWYELISKMEYSNTNKSKCLNTCSALLEAGIIVQSNFRIYCYTASPLQAKILRHLCQVKVRGPNVISGILSRKGLLSAYSMGVSAEQILRFFSCNAHPIILRRNMLEGTSIIPINVETQLKLWEKDKNRLKITYASTFSDWGTNSNDIQLYAQTVLYAKSKDILLYYIPIDIIEKELCIENTDVQKKIILVTKQEYEDDIKAFIRARREIIYK
ncbi:putative transcription factor TFIIH [Cryptosporidium canis]|uniref:General transcription factor IIH subunit 4 n=1 Tax=Cryptosporidium canis TaxID=195482 RepID=A0ABQ8PC96_9CRYT|nr:putative transcription factor TFIIH [Cryptosporidium canis]KAJ1615268.1 putative transcription factor TFIIH [Cryptosporidium canis]